jgi:hypothetical protein
VFVYMACACCFRGGRQVIAPGCITVVRFVIGVCVVSMRRCVVLCFAVCVCGQYEEMREEYFESLKDRRFLTLEQARAKKLSIDFAAFPPRAPDMPGVHTIVEDIRCVVLAQVQYSCMGCGACVCWLVSGFFLWPLCPRCGQHSHHARYTSALCAFVHAATVAGALGLA